MLRSVNDYINAGLTHSLHTSERRSFRGCRRRWDWISRQMYYPRVTARPLEFGVAFHAAMEAYYGFWLGLWENPDPEAALQLALIKFREITDSQRAAYIRMNDEISPEMSADYKDRVKLGESMLKYYFRTIAPKADMDLKPLKVEIKFEVPITGPNGETLWCKCDHCWARYTNWWLSKRPEPLGGVDPEQERAHWKGLPVTYGGRIDIIFQDRYGRIWVGDWKTAARLSGVDTNTTDDYMWNDDQITSYCWALASIGLDVAGFIYAEIKKAVPEEPELLSRPYKGRMFSTNKQQTTTLALFRNTVSENDVEAYESGAYDDFLEYLKHNAPQFHARHQIHRNDEELRQAGEMIYLEATEMTNPSLPIYPNPGRFHCKGFTDASGCAFWEPCLGKNRGEDYEYTLETMFEKRTRHYWEEAQPSTDKRMEAL